MKRIIVDENDREIGAKEASELLPEDIYRVSALWLTNPKGEILLAKRALGMRNDPGKWSCAVAGTVEEGETYDMNIVKEVEEEIGLRDLILRRGPKMRRTGNHEFFCQWYLATVDVAIEALAVQKEEVAAVKWISEQDLFQAIDADAGQFTNNAKDWKRRIELLKTPLDPPPFALRPGQRDHTNNPRPETVNCIVQCGSEILLVKRNSKMNTYPGLWNGISGYLDDEKSAIEKAKEELLEEAAIGADRIMAITEGPVVEMKDPALGKTWVTHPILVTVRRKGVILDWEAEDARWMAPEEVRAYPTISGFDRVMAPFFQ